MSAKSKLLCAVLILAAVALTVWSIQDPGLDSPAAETTGADTTATEHAAEARTPRPAGTEKKSADAEPSREEVAEKTPPTPAAKPRFSGRVRDVHGRGVGGADVAFETRSYDGTKKTRGATLAEHTVQSGADGMFSMVEPDRSGYLVASSDTYTTLLDSVWDGKKRKPEIVVAPRRNYSGVVVDEQGGGIPGKTVMLRPDEALLFSLRPGVEMSSVVAWNAATDPQGGFSFTDIPWSAGTAITVDVPGFEPLQSTVPEQSTSKIRLVLVRKRAYDHSITGRVVWKSGKPVPEALVFFGDARVRADARGRFVFERKTPHEGGELIAATKGWLPVRFKLEAGQNPGEILLTVEDRPLRIRGRIVDADGRPVPDAVALTWDANRIPRGGRYGTRYLEDIIDENYQPGRAKSGRRHPVDNEGWFTLSPLLAGKYQVFAMRASTMEAVSAGKVAAGTEDLEIVLPGSATKRRVAGRVVSLSGDPLPGVMMFVGRKTQLGETVFFAPLVTKGTPKTDAEGRFSFDALCVEGTYLLPAGENARNAESVILDPGADLTRMEIRIPSACKLQVLVGDPDAADNIKVLDGKGQSLSLLVTLANTMRSGHTMPLTKGRSEIIEVDERARTLVLLRNGKEVRRIDLSLEPKQTRVIRL